MKCQNCGINYDDSERECPMCGAKAGRGTRAAAPHYTGYSHTVHDEKSCTHQTFTKDETFSARPPAAKPVQRTQPVQPRATVLNGSPAKKAGGKGASIAVVVIVIALAVLLPIIQSFAEHFDELRYYLQDGSPYEDFSTLPASDEPEYDGYDDMILEPMLQGDWLIERADGGMIRLSIDGDDFYTLTCETEAYRYTETGTVWLWHNREEQVGYWNDTYTPDRYRGYTFNLDRDSMSAEGAVPAALASGKDRDVFMIIFEEQAQTDGLQYTVWDYAGQGAPLFSGEYMEMHKVQGG